MALSLRVDDCDEEVEILSTLRREFHNITSLPDTLIQAMIKEIETLKTDLDRTTQCISNQQFLRSEQALDQRLEAVSSEL